MILSDILAHHGDRYRQKTAVISGETRLSYGALHKRVLRLANALGALGLSKGERVGVLSTNRGEYIECVFAFSEAGLVWVPLNYRLTAMEVGFIVNDAECAALIYSDDLNDIAEALVSFSPTVRAWVAIGGSPKQGVRYEDIISEGRAVRNADRPDGSDVVAIMYTSGTTGHPKGATLTHRQLISGMTYTAIASGASADDISLQVIPQFHAGGNIAQMAEILVGATTVVAPRFDPELIISLIEAERVNFVCFVPSMLMFLLECPTLTAQRVSSLQRVMYGGSAISPDRLTRALEIFHADFQQVYGQTEACVFVTMMSGEDHRVGLQPGKADRLLSCGREILGYAVRVVNEEDKDLPANEIGEVVVRGDSVMQGYWNRADATAKTLRNGWLHTGDLGYRDNDNYLFIVDRKIDLIVSGGENVYPVEVENTISAHPKVLEVAVIGVPDPAWGEAVKAIVVKRDGVQLSEADIIEFCRGKIARFKTPKSIEFAASLPRTPSGKVMKLELRKPYWLDKPRGVN